MKTSQVTQPSSGLAEWNKYPLLTGFKADPRYTRPNDNVKLAWERRIKTLEAKMQLAEAQQKRLPKDPKEFFVQVLGLEAIDYQTRLAEAFLKNQFVAARWCRQSGKSHTIAAFLLYHAVQSRAAE